MKAISKVHFLQQSWWEVDLLKIDENMEIFICWENFIKVSKVQSEAQFGG